jgi:glycosyltransferase involved in cell wall biosynthesis
MLEEHGIEHIHIHHGYFGSWVGMVAARLLGVSFSLTLHGSDLLLSGHYLEAKLANCHFCITISKYNRDHILRQFPGIDPGKIVVCRLGVDTLETTIGIHPRQSERLSLLTVGRLHEVKDHAFLVRACAHLRQRGLNFECAIAGEGPERKRLELLIQENNLRDRVTLLGHVEPPQMDRLYQRADLIVLTSRSEGIPLVLMEAMANGKIVLAPAITGIPELVIHATTGFLYRAGALDEFVNATIGLNELLRDEHKSENNRLQWIRHAARAQILHNFDRRKNLGRFADQFLERMVPLEPVTSSAASLLQIVASGSSEMKAS